ncbi:MAG: ZIP family metal transporter [Spirochaetales bacterium]
MLKIILFSGLAGILGTGLGGFLGIFFGKKTEKTISRVLTFASGIMVSIALFDLIPEAYNLSNSFITVGGVAIGVAIIFAFNHYIDRMTQKAKNNIKTHDSLESLHHQEGLLLNPQQKHNLLRAGIIMLVAISIHNIPEGMAIGASNAVSFNLSLTLAVLLTLHNIPEGMAISVPLSIGGVNKVKTILLVILAGSTTVIGGALGAMLGSLGGIITAIALSFAAGAMLYVTFCEIIPESVLMEHGSVPSLFAIAGILTGFMLTTLM